MKMDFNNYDSLADSPASDQPNLGRHSPCRPSFFSALFAAGRDFLTIVCGIFFLCALACSLPLALFLMFFASY